MASKQYLLLVLGVIIVAAAIMFGIRSFRNNRARVHKSILINQMTSFYSDATTFRKKSKILGGGSGTYLGFKPAGATEYQSISEATAYFKVELINANYFVQTDKDNNHLKIIASSKIYGDGTDALDGNNSCIAATFDAEGRLKSGYEFTGNW